MWLSIAFVSGIVATLATLYGIHRWRRSRSRWLSSDLQRFFGITDSTQVEVKDRSFTCYAAPDVKLGLEQWYEKQQLQVKAVGVPVSDSFMSQTSIGTLLAPRGEESYQASSVEYERFDIGEGQIIECPRHALWFVTSPGGKIAILWTSNTTHGRSGLVTRLRIEVGFLKTSPPQDLVDSLFQELERTVQEGRAYRGKILSLEEQENYDGSAGGIKVHRLRKVAREDVILPEQTVTLLERNLIRFVEQREQLAKLGMPTKKGLLFYGPPGTGKTHTIHYLVGALQGHTTLLITAEQIGALSEYITMARLLQPSIVVIEDVDLIATQRDRSGVCQQSLLNRLLNEMDGLREDAAILFLLTTNRPQDLEAALAARPGRVDQAVEFPLPDPLGREKLFRLYASGAKIAGDVVRETVRQTEGVSASFIKELMRRSLQFHLECQLNSSQPEILKNDIDQAIEELLWSGGLLNRTLLGAGEYSDDR